MLTETLSFGRHDNQNIQILQKLFFMIKNLYIIFKYMYKIYIKSLTIGRGKWITGSRSTFEFPSRVNLSDHSLYCT